MERLMGLELMLFTLSPTMIFMMLDLTWVISREKAGKIIIFFLVVVFIEVISLLLLDLKNG